MLRQPQRLPSSKRGCRFGVRGVEEEKERLERRKKELEELISGEKEILLKKNIPVEQMMEFLGYEKLTEEMLEKYVDGIYVYDDGRVKIKYK